MKTSLALLALVAALPLSGAAKRDPLAGRIAGPPQHCINTFPSTDGPVAIGRNTIIYRQNPKRTWVSHPQGACPALRDFTTLIIDRQEGSQLCDTDRFRVLAPGETIPSAYCRFGPFIPYDRTGK